MLNTLRSRRGMVTTPHHLASQSALAVLREGGTAIEAAVTAAATIAVVYPHMNSIGGDSFWLIRMPGSAPVSIDACGRAACAAEVGRYREAGLTVMPTRGPLAANTVAGTVSGWQAALNLSHACQRGLPLSRLLRDAIDYAADGVPVTASFCELLQAKYAELSAQPGFAEVFLTAGDQADTARHTLPRPGSLLRQARLAHTLQTLAVRGLQDFYQGEVADAIAADLSACGSLLSRDDLHQHRAEVLKPLQVDIDNARLFNMAPPTQGVASLMILALFDRLQVDSAEGFAHVHGLVECTKRAFRFRDAAVGDPQYMPVNAQQILNDADGLQRLAAGIDRHQASPWPWPSQAGDTVWLSCVDRTGCAVSLIQSTYFEFGSGVVLPGTGIVWQNRGASFRIADDGWNALKPRRKPFHTLNPAMAQLVDGRWMSYGTMGGEGQPQTQAAVFSRYARFGQALQQAVTAPRWLLGRTWGADSTTLKVENRFAPQVLEQLSAAGHALEVVEPFTSMMGHAGAIVQCADGTLEGACDPRSDGSVAAY